MAILAIGCNGSLLHTSADIIAITRDLATYGRDASKRFRFNQTVNLLTVLRYVERNPVRAVTIPVRKAQNWPWSSAGTPPKEFETVKLFRGPVKRREDWLDWVNKPLTDAEVDAVRLSVKRGRPYGSETWQKRTSKMLDLEFTMRPRGLPRKLKK